MTSNKSSEKPTGFMSEYMSDLGQSQDLNSFLEKNQPNYDPKSHSQIPTSESTSNTRSNKEKRQDDIPQSNKSSSSPSSSSSSSPYSSSTSSDGSKKSGKVDMRELAKSHSIGDSHYHYQRQAIKSAAFDNCADINMDLVDCMSGKSGSWRDRASLCIEKSKLLETCCRLNKDILQEKGYAQAGNTPEKDKEILAYADEQAQKAMKEGKA